MKVAVSIVSVCILIAVTFMTLPLWSEAQPGGRDGGGREGERPPQGPPQEAIAACEGKSEGDSCQFSTPRGDTLEGTCRSIEEQLACAPEGGAHGGRPPRDDSQN